MNSVTYNIPAELVSEYRGRPVIVRSLDPGEIVRELSDECLDDVQFVRLLSPKVAPDALATLARWGRSVPLDIVLDDPASEFPLLYNFAKLLDKHPIRATIAVKPGFGKAVKLALALHFAVKLDVGQPDPQLIDEMNDVLDVFLHRASVSQPVEYFHSIFLSLYRQEPTSLWIVQEDDPELYRFITDAGVEKLSPRFGGSGPAGITDARAAESVTAGSRGELECDACEFLPVCRRYFKWPDRSYECLGVKSIFSTLDAAAAELRENVAGFSATLGGSQL